jgi:hypothetical protein
MSRRLIPVALLVASSSSAMAFDTSKLGQWGSLFLDDLAPIIATSTRLRGALSDQQKRRRSDVLWNALSGLVEKSRRPSSVALHV